jgi:hypothetical protein
VGKLTGGRRRRVFYLLLLAGLAFSYVAVVLLAAFAEKDGCGAQPEAKGAHGGWHAGLSWLPPGERCIFEDGTSVTLTPLHARKH